MLLNEFNLLRAVEIICAISLLIQGAEFLRMRSASTVNLGWNCVKNILTVIVRFTNVNLILKN